jgi:hypothetical protein
MLWKRQYRAADNLPSDEKLDAALEIVRRFVAWAAPIFQALADAARTFIEACYNLYASWFSISAPYLAYVLRMGVLEDRRAAGSLRYESYRDRWRENIKNRHVYQMRQLKRYPLSKGIRRIIPGQHEQCLVEIQEALA